MQLRRQSEVASVWQSFAEEASSRRIMIRQRGAAARSRQRHDARESCFTELPRLNASHVVPPAIHLSGAVQLDDHALRRTGHSKRHHDQRAKCAAAAFATRRIHDRN